MKFDVKGYSERDRSVMDGIVVPQSSLGAAGPDLTILLDHQMTTNWW